MFVRNFSLLLVANSRIHSTSSSQDDNYQYYSVRSTTGDNFSPGFDVYHRQYEQGNTKVFYSDDVWLGDSDAQVSYDQYNLQGNKITLSDVTIKREFGITENGDIEIFIEIIGTPSENSVVKEIALIKNIYRSNDSATVMVYREVLSTPIELTANTQANLRFKITYPLL